MNMDYKILKEEINKIEDEIIKWRRDIHQHPETGFKEKRTSKKIREMLKKWGYEVEEPLKTGVVGLLRGKKSDEFKTLAIRADIDALPLKELNDLPYRSQNEGVMHACGHDAHTAIALGTAKIMAKYKDEIKGNIKFIFQPAEEGPGGAEPMVEKGVMNDVDMIFALHVNPDIAAGKFAYKAGALMAAPDEFKIKVKGKGTHGAHPDQGIDPVVLGSHLVLALQEIVSREIEALEPVILTCGTFHAGTKNNIIPDEAEITGTVRTLNPEIRKIMKEKIERTSKGITASFGADIDIEYNFNYPVLINDEDAMNFAKGILLDILDDKDLVELKKPSMGGEDFSYYLQKKPGAYVYLGTYNHEKKADKPLHNAHFNIDESTMSLGVEFFSRASFEYLK